MTATGHRNRTNAIVENIRRRGREVVRHETQIDLAEGDRERIARLEAEVAELRLALQQRPTPAPANDSLLPGLQDIVQRLKSLSERVTAIEAEAGKRSRVPAPVIVDPNPVEVTTLAERVDALEQHAAAAGELQTEMSEVLEFMGAFVEKIDSIAKQSADGHRIASDAMECIKIAAGARG